MVRYFGDGSPARIFWALHLAAVHLWAVHALSADGREAPVRTEPLPTAMSVALMPRSDQRPVALVRDGSLDNDDGNWDKKIRPRKLCAYHWNFRASSPTSRIGAGQDEGFL
jgi:hypothetical protein